MAVFSGLLDSYAVRPSWQVAGVDYDVGTPSGTKLKDPSTIKMSGVSVNASTHTVTVSGSNVTLDGYDFSLGGGWQVSVVNNANNVTIQNSYFKVGSNNLMPIDADRGGSVNVLHNTFEGGADTGSTVNSMFYTGAGAVVEYNRFTKFPNDAIDITHDGNYTIQYNLFDTMGTGAYHSDAIQTYFSDIQSLVVQYNTMYQPPNWTGPDEINAFFRIGDQQGHVVHNPVAAYNTIVMPSSNAPTSAVFQWGSGGAGTLVNPSIHDNFIDPAGVRYSIVSTYLQDKTGVINPVTYNNIDMTSGKALLSGQYENRSSGVPSKAPAAPVITGQTAESATQIKLTGTAQAGLVVDVFDKGALIGSVKASSTGAWTFTTSSLANGDHVFTARATDTYTNTGAASAPLIVTVTGSGQPTTPTVGAPTIESFSNDSGTAGDRITNDNTVTLTGKAAANSTIKVFDGVTQIGTATADANGAWSFTSKALTEGAHSLTATATSGSATSPASAALALTVDTLAPTAPTLTMSASAASASLAAVASTNVAQLNGTAEANSTVTVFDGATKVGTVTANSSGAWSWTSGTLAAGNHSFTVKAMDAAGNTGAASAALVITVPSAPTAPGAPTIASFSNDSGVPGDRITNDNTVTLTGKAAANSAIKVFDGTTQIGTATADANGAWSFTSKALTEGKHSLTATATSGGATSPASTTLALTIDTVAPTAPTVKMSTSAATLASTKVAQLGGTAEANSTVTVFDGTTKVGTVTANSSGAWSWTSGTLATGSHSFTAKAMDVAGNTGVASAAVAVTVPSAPTAPGAPTIASFSNDSGVAGDRITNDNTVTLTGKAVANSAIKVFDGTTQIGTATADANGAWSFTSKALTEGKHSLTATATSGGATSPASTTLALTIDTVAPTAPTVKMSTSAATLASTKVAQLGGTAEANSTVTVFDGTTKVGTVTANSSGAWSWTSGTLATGSHSFTAKAMDVAGNTGAASAAVAVTVPSAPTAPGAPTIASFSNDSGVAGDRITNDNTLTLTGSAAANSTVKVFDGTTQVGSATTNANGQWTLTTTVLKDGGHSLTATATNSSGLTSSASTVLPVTIDTKAPIAPTLGLYSQSGASIGSATSLDDFTLKGTAEANSSVKVFDGAKQIGTATTNSSGAWSLNIDNLGSGAHSFTATATDVAGNASTASTTKSVSVTAPTAPTASIEFTSVSDSWSYSTIKGTADPGSLLKLYDGKTAIGTVTAGMDGSWSFWAKGLSDKVHTFTAQELDSSGKVVGVSSGQAILGSSWANVLTGTSGDDYLSGNGNSDTFVFAPRFGNDVIKDFDATGRDHDTIQFSSTVFDSFASVLSHASQVGQDVVISSGNDTLTLKNVKMSSLSSHDFQFA